MNKERLKELEKEASDKYYARRAVTNAIEYGRLVKEPCSVCGEQKVEAHHPDYSKPFEVVWVCKPHHAELDKKRRNDELLKRTGIILD